MIGLWVLFYFLFLLLGIRSGDQTAGAPSVSLLKSPRQKIARRGIAPGPSPSPSPLLIEDVRLQGRVPSHDGLHLREGFECRSGTESFYHHHHHHPSSSTSYCIIHIHIGRNNHLLSTAATEKRGWFWLLLSAPHVTFGALSSIVIHQSWEISRAACACACACCTAADASDPHPHPHPHPHRTR